jgi:hypothetical protein
MRLSHGPVISCSNEATLAAVFDTDLARAEAITRDFGGKAFDNLDQLLETGGVDAVIVATPNRFHAEGAIAAANHGKHVLCEKPLAITTAECDAMIAAAKKSGVVLSTYHNRHWDGCILSAIDHIKKNKRIGEIVRVEARMGERAQPGDWWRGSRSISGGILYDWGVHLLEYSLLLIDSGGQYLGGTTDITRVWPIGTPTAAMKRDYTLVLKGTMNLSRTRFPRGTLSPMLDALARAPMWQEGLEFGHGTGHGVGYFLNVHEGPQSISKAIPDASMAMEPGMITSVEPGVYRPGQWGVRIENLVMNVPAQTPEGSTFAEMLEFETLTLCPIDTRCIDRSLLREDEVAWLNAYHAVVRERLATLVSGAALAWLTERTEPLV